MNQSSKGRRSKSQGRPTGADCSYRPNIGDSLPKIISFINNLNTGCISLKNLHEKFRKFSRDQLWSYIKNNPTNFCIEKENKNEASNQPSINDLIRVKTDLRLCEKHCRRGKTCSGQCGELHLCRTFLLLGDMCCPFQKSGKVCAFGHKFDTNHNSNLLRAHNLTSLSDNELRVLFRRRVCRSVSTMPQICIYYNGQGGKGCSNTRCKSLHLCLDFVQDKCHGLCRKNHSISNEQVALILDLFAIDQSWPDQSVLQDLRSIMKNRIRHNSDVSSVVSTDSNGLDVDDDSDTELKDYDGASSRKTKENNTVINCCSHCKEMRTVMMKMSEKLEDLEKQLHHLKTSNESTRNEMAADKDEFSTDEKQKLSERLFPIVEQMHPTLAVKITQMILDMNKTQLQHVLTSQEALKLKIDEATGFFKSFQTNV